MAVRLRVKEVAKEKGIGMGKLQRMSDVAYNTVRRIYKDPYYITTTETLGKIARALGVPVLATWSIRFKIEPQRLPLAWFCSILTFLDEEAV
jgi:lambda repressor-like predicted transcriptional regulator